MDFGGVDQRADAEDGSFQGISKSEPHLLLLGSVGEKSDVSVNEGAVNPGGFPCMVKRDNCW